jgi:putative transposase
MLHLPVIGYSYVQVFPQPHGAAGIGGENVSSGGEPLQIWFRANRTRPWRTSSLTSDMRQKEAGWAALPARHWLDCSLKAGSFGGRVFRSYPQAWGGSEAMQASRFSEAQSAFILKQGGDGIPVADLSQGADQLGDLPKWKKKYDVLLPTEMKCLRRLEDENAKLRRVVADLGVDKEMLQDVIRRKL